MLKRALDAGPALLGAAGLGVVTAGVAVLIGLGWALVAAGVSAVLVAVDWRSSR